MGTCRTSRVAEAGGPLWRYKPLAGTATAILTALGAAAFLFAHDAQALALGSVGLLSLGVASMLSRRSRQPWEWLLLGFCVLSTLGAVGASIWGYGYLVESILIAAYCWLGFLVYHTGAARHVWLWLAGALGIHAGVILVQGFAHFRDAAYRAGGLADNVNQAAGYLDVAVVSLVAAGKWWLAPPFLLALLFTGSRLGFWVLIAVLTAMTFRWVLPRRGLATLVAFLAVSAWLLWPQPERIFFQTKTGGELQSDVVSRAQVPTGGLMTGGLPQGYAPGGLMTGGLPQGYAGDPGLHVSPLRMFYETGVLGPVAWYGPIVASLWKGRRRPDTAWWLHWLFLGLSSLDFYMIMPPAVLMWWLALAKSGGDSFLSSFACKVKGDLTRHCSPGVTSRRRSQKEARHSVSFASIVI